MYKFYNPNPMKKLTGDCVIRAICKLTGDDWETVYIHVIVQGYKMKDMPNQNVVWGAYLASKGYSRHLIPEECPLCFTLRDFCERYRSGKYLVATGSHVIAVEDGDYYDTWDSGDEIVLYYWRKEEEDERA